MGRGVRGKKFRSLVARRPIFLQSRVLEVWRSLRWFLGIAAVPLLRGPRPASPRAPGCGHLSRRGVDVAAPTPSPRMSEGVEGPPLSSCSWSPVSTRQGPSPALRPGGPARPHARRGGARVSRSGSRSLVEAAPGPWGSSDRRAAPGRTGSGARRAGRGAQGEGRVREGAQGPGRARGEEPRARRTAGASRSASPKTNGAAAAENGVESFHSAPNLVSTPRPDPTPRRRGPGAGGFARIIPPLVLRRERSHLWPATPARGRVREARHPLPLPAGPLVGVKRRNERNHPFTGTRLRPLSVPCLTGAGPKDAGGLATERGTAWVQEPSPT